MRAMPQARLWELTQSAQAKIQEESGKFGGGRSLWRSRAAGSDTNERQELAFFVPLD